MPETEALDEPAVMEAESDEAQPITWTASEFVAHQKTSGWYLNLTVAALVLAALAYLITRDKVSVAVVVVGAIFMGVYASHEPRQKQYLVDDGGITIDGVRHTYSEYKSFSVVMDGAFPCLVLLPLRRFALLTTVYYDPADETGILTLLTRHLPHEEPRRDIVESLMRRIRF